MYTLILIAVAIAGLAIGVLLTATLMRRSVLKKSREVLEEAKEKAEVIKKDKILQAKEKFLQLKGEHEKIVAEKNSVIQNAENKPAKAKGVRYPEDEFNESVGNS